MLSMKRAFFDKNFEFIVAISEGKMRSYSLNLVYLEEISGQVYTEVSAK